MSKRKRKKEDCILIVPCIIIPTAAARPVKNYKVHRLTYHNCCRHIRRLIWKPKRTSRQPSQILSLKTLIHERWSIFHVRSFDYVCLVLFQLLLVLFFLVVATSATAQFDFFESIANFFNPSSNNINNNINNNSDKPRGGGRGCAAGGNPTNYKYAGWCQLLTNVTLNLKLRFGGKDYLVSWRIGCSQFTQAGAEHFCEMNGMR